MSGLHPRFKSPHALARVIARIANVGSKAKKTLVYLSSMPAAAAPPSSVGNSRRFMSSTGLSPRFWTGDTRNDHPPTDGPCSRFAAR
jgi:hypothetical protein